MGDRLGIQVAVDILPPSHAFFPVFHHKIFIQDVFTFSPIVSTAQQSESPYSQDTAAGDCLPAKNCLAPGEARTHGLQIMRLTRCLLRYGGWWEASVRASPLETVWTAICQNYLSEVGFEPTPS